MFDKPFAIIATSGFARTVNQSDTTLHDLSGSHVDADALFFEIFQNKVRRASRYVKFSNLAALLALKQIDFSVLKDKRIGLFLGTGLGNTPDTVKFTSEVLNHYDTCVSPSTFINTVSNAGLFYAARALEMKCTTNVISQETISFEAALLTASVMLKSGELDFALVGGTDVIEPPYDISMERLNSKNVTADSLGEGAAFLLLQREAVSSAKVHGHLLDVQVGVSENKGSLALTLSSDYLGLGIDHCEKEASYRYRHLCGDYSTGSAFGLCRFLSDPSLKNEETFFHLNHHQNGAFASFKVRKTTN